MEGIPDERPVRRGDIRPVSFAACYLDVPKDSHLRRAIGPNRAALNISVTATKDVVAAEMGAAYSGPGMSDVGRAQAVFIRFEIDCQVRLVENMLAERNGSTTPALTRGNPGRLLVRVSPLLGAGGEPSGGAALGCERGTVKIPPV